MFVRKAIRNVIFLFLFIPQITQAQVFDEDDSFLETGFWLGGSFPAPNTRTDEILDSSMGFGIFLRFPFFYQPFLLETGTSYGSFQSLTMQRLTSIPLYLSMNYPFEIINRFQLLLKFGLVASYLEVRPNNVSGWNPGITGGLEFSISASKKFKVGIRLDGYYIIDDFRKKPESLKNLYLLSDSFTPYIYNYRLLKNFDFQMENASFYNFGLLATYKF